MEALSCSVSTKETGDSIFFKSCTATTISISMGSIRMEYSVGIEEVKVSVPAFDSNLRQV